MKRSLILTLTFVAAIAMVTAVVALANAPTAPTAPARVRVAHTAFDAPAVDVLVNGTDVFTDVEYKEVTGYGDLPGGTYTVTIEPAAGGSAVFTASLTVADDTDYTVAAAGTLTNPTYPFGLQVYVDNNAIPAMGMAHVRFIHLAPGAPPVDIVVAGTPAIPVITNTAYLSASAYTPVAAGSYDLQVRVAGSTAVVLSLPGITLDPKTVYTVLAVGNLTGEGTVRPLEAVIVVDTRQVELYMPIVTSNFTGTTTLR
jgi:hypothetical protein